MIHGLDSAMSENGLRLLYAGLGFAGLREALPDPALKALRSWLDSWSGGGRVAMAMARQGYDLQPTRCDAKGWRATFDTTGMERSVTSATASAWRACTCGTRIVRDAG
jgi:hypothetical protein